MDLASKFDSMSLAQKEGLTSVASQRGAGSKRWDQGVVVEGGLGVVSVGYGE